MIPIKMICIKCGKLMKIHITYKKDKITYFYCPYCEQPYKAIPYKLEPTVNIYPIDDKDFYNETIKTKENEKDN